MHMALVVSAIANDGVLMNPYLIDHTENYNGIVVDAYEPTEYGTLLSTEDASLMQTFMREVVEEPENVSRGRVILPREKQERQSFQRPQRLPMHGLWVMPTVRTRKISQLRLSWRIPDQAVSMQFRSQKRFLMHIISKQGRKDISVLVA